MYKYFAYGLNISSEIELNELIQKDFSEEVDISLKLGKVSEQIAGDEWYSTWWQVNEEFLLCDYTGIMRALVHRDGKEAHIQVFSEDLFQLRSFIYSRVISAILLLRGDYLLHGACAQIGADSYAFCGPSGVGKSTLAYALHEAGYKVYSDDVSCLRIQAEEVYLYPGFPRLRLTDEIRAEVRGDFKEIGHYPGKYDYLGEWKFDLKAVKFKGMMLLRAHAENHVQFEEVTGVQKLDLLEEARYRRGIEALIYSKQQILQRRINFSQLIDCQYLLRPQNRLCVEDMTKFITENLRGV